MIHLRQHLSGITSECNKKFNRQLPCTMLPNLKLTLFSTLHASNNSPCLFFPPHTFTHPSSLGQRPLCMCLRSHPTPCVSSGKVQKKKLFLCELIALYQMTHDYETDVCVNSSKKSVCCLFVLSCQSIDRR